MGEDSPWCRWNPLSSRNLDRLVLRAASAAWRLRLIRILEGANSLCAP